jgi:L-arabinose transport system permease protein
MPVLKMEKSDSTMAAAPSGPGRWNAKVLLAEAWERAGMLLVFFLLFIVCALAVPNFMTGSNMISLALAVSTIGIVACTMLFCLASGHFDLSVGSIVACAGVVAAVVINGTGSVFLGIASGIAGGALVGVCNGFVIAKWQINALIATLATMQIVRGLGYIISDGRAVGIREEGFFFLGNSMLFAIPTPVWITVACFLFFGFLLSRTAFGRNTLAIGGNPEAARLAGVPVDRVKITIFAVQGAIAGLAGIIIASRMTSGQPTAFVGFELQVISACVLGGVSLAGGIGTIFGVVAGVLILGTMQNSMNLLNVPPFYQLVASGVILLIAVLIDRARQKGNL